MKDTEGIQNAVNILPTSQQKKLSSAKEGVKYLILTDLSIPRPRSYDYVSNVT